MTDFEYTPDTGADDQGIPDPVDSASPLIDRRLFLATSIATAATSTLAGSIFAPGALAQARGGGSGTPPSTQPPTQPQVQLVPLGNGEPPALQFQPYPAGTGALMEKLARERGRAAFDRAVFTVQPWRGAVPTSDDDLAWLPAHRLSALLRERRITATRLTDVYLARIKRLNPTLNFVVTLLEESARAQAAQADAEIRSGKYRGPLHGLPYGLKDLFATKGVRTTWGARDFENRVIDEDAEIVVRLRDAGAILVAKLSTGLFAQNDWWYGGRTNNPWNPDVGSSGSSAGPGSAVAAGCVAFAIGTETQGSIVSPALRNGISALRPTFGRVSRHGGMVLSWSQDRVGPMCRTVEDCAMVFNAIHGSDEKDPSTLTTPFQFDRNVRLATLRIGVDANAPREVVDKLRELGADPKPIAARPDIRALTGGGLNVEYSAAFEDYIERKAREAGLSLDSLSAPNAGRGGGGGGAATPPTPESCMAPADWNPRFVRGRSVRAFDFIQNQRRRYAYMVAYAKVLDGFDMFVSNAPGWDIANNAQTGHPCVVVPYKFDRLANVGGSCPPAQAGWESKHQPIGAVIVGNLYEDDKILSVAHQLQVSGDVHTRRPAL